MARIAMSLRLHTGCRSMEESASMMHRGSLPLEEADIRVMALTGVSIWPTQKAKEMYNLISDGTPVICHY